MTAHRPEGPRCVAYTSENPIFFRPGVVKWLTGPAHPEPHGTIQVGNRRGRIYYVRTLIDERNSKWPDAVREWLDSRRGNPDTLVVMWD